MKHLSKPTEYATGVNPNINLCSSDGNDVSRWVHQLSPMSQSGEGLIMGEAVHMGWGGREVYGDLVLSADFAVDLKLDSKATELGSAKLKFSLFSNDELSHLEPLSQTLLMAPPMSPRIHCSSAS